MLSVLIIVTSANKRKSFGLKTYNEQEVGLAKSLSKRGVECGIAYYGGDVEREDLVDCGGIKIKMYLFRGFDFLKNVFFKSYDHIYNQYDILLPITYDHYESYHIAMKYPEKTIIYHGTYYSSFNKRYNFKCKVVDPFIIPGYRKKNTTFVTKNNLAADFLKDKGIFNTKVIGVGFDAEQMAGRERQESEISNALHTFKKEGYKILLYVGRIEPRRNTLFLLEVFDKIRKREKVKLVIIGKGNVEYVEKCRQLIKAKGLKNDILYVERMEQRNIWDGNFGINVFSNPCSYDFKWRF